MSHGKMSWFSFTDFALIFFDKKKMTSDLIMSCQTVSDFV